LCLSRALPKAPEMHPGTLRDIAGAAQTLRETLRERPFRLALTRSSGPAPGRGASRTLIRARRTRRRPTDPSATLCTHPVLAYRARVPGREGVAALARMKGCAHPLGRSGTGSSNRFLDVAEQRPLRERIRWMGVAPDADDGPTRFGVSAQGRLTRRRSRNEGRIQRTKPPGVEKWPAVAASG
jgi:hypothetical protein